METEAWRRLDQLGNGFLAAQQLVELGGQQANPTFPVRRRPPGGDLLASTRAGERERGRQRELGGEVETMAQPGQVLPDGSGMSATRGAQHGWIPDCQSDRHHALLPPRGCAAAEKSRSIHRPTDVLRVVPWLPTRECCSGGDARAPLTAMLPRRRRRVASGWAAGAAVRGHPAARAA